jgi:RimJ/RimL family protein N-acetyltransferase
MTLKLRAPTAGDVEQVRRWRSDDGVRAGLRTPFLLTEEMQADFYRDVVCDRRSPHRYWSFDGPGQVSQNYKALVAFGGLTDIAWENGHAEISLIVNPDHAGKGVGSEPVRLILHEAFGRMRLLTVFGEVYDCNPALAFWQKMVETVPGGATHMPGRKWWDGRLWGATLFWFTAP